MLPEVEDWLAQEKLQHEFDAIGFYLSAHPLEAYRKSCDRLGVLDWADVQAGRVRDIRVKMAGIVGARKVINSARCGQKIGRASCRARVCQYVSISVVDV